MKKLRKGDRVWTIWNINDWDMFINKASRLLLYIDSGYAPTLKIEISQAPLLKIIYGV